jgi:hypothetical protein
MAYSTADWTNKLSNLTDISVAHESHFLPKSLLAQGLDALREYLDCLQNLPETKRLALQHKGLDAFPYLDHRGNGVLSIDVSNNSDLLQEILT